MWCLIKRYFQNDCIMKEGGIIDFVITWVDGSDDLWQKEYNKYAVNLRSEDVGDHRYRDWGILPFWFRSVEAYAPWVRNIYFVTSGHYPTWLNIKHPKLKLVKHSDYMPEEILPVFNSRPIELYLNRIEGLSEQFVLFNDDMFLVNKMKPTDFFKSNLPVDISIISAQSGAGISNVIMNDLKVLNNNFDKYTVLKNNFYKFFNYRYGFENFRTLLLMPWPRFTGFFDPHQPQPYLKSSFDQVWEIEEKELMYTCKHRFRSGEGCNHYLIRYWQLVSGNFMPSRLRGRMLDIVKSSLEEISQTFTRSKYMTACLNDTPCENSTFEQRKEYLHNFFQTVFPKKSSFEI